MVVVLPTPLIDRWVQARRGIDKFDVDLPSPRWQVPAAEMTRRCIRHYGIGKAVSHIKLPFIVATSAMLDLDSALPMERNNRKAGVTKAARWHW